MDTRYVLVWTTSSGERGAYCPAGGMTQDEAERAKESLYATARENGITPIKEKTNDSAPSIGASIVPYYFDVREAF